MRTSESLDKIAPALVAARAKCRGIFKSGNNTFDKYRYANLLDYVEGTQESLCAAGLVLITSVPTASDPVARPTKSGGNEWWVRVSLTVRVLHESGQWIEDDFAGEGQDRGDKGIYKAITGARKYAIASLLNLATTDDPESDGTPQGEPPAAQRPVAPRPAAKSGDPLMESVAAWSGVSGADLVSAMRAVASASGNPIAPGTKATADQRSAMLAWVEAQRKAGADFMFATAPKGDK